jgi:hypothetical protein
MNCGAAEAPHIFQGVTVCPTCYQVASHCLQRAKNELHMLFTAYVEMIRVALVKGELRLPAMPQETTMPLTELSKAIRTQRERHNAQETTTKREG